MDANNRSNDIFFTIIIPTRERSDTLMHTLKSALSQDYEYFNVLVSDNASDDDTAEKVAEIKDSRLRYINTGRRVSMSENWEFAISHVDGGWVTILGDDDAILPGALNRVNEIIKETGASAVRSNGCSYRWPGFNGSNYGSLSLSLRRGYETRCSGSMLQQVLNGERPYNELPMLYNGGFVSSDLIRQAKSVTGKFFQSMIPDVYSAVVLSLLTESYVYSHEPLAINGASLHSGGTASFEKVKQKRSYDPAEKFWSETNIPFHDDLPLMRTGRPVRSISIIVYESFLQARQFHRFKDVATTHERQLGIAIEKSGPDPNEVEEWVFMFAEKHNIKINSQLKSRLRLAGIFRKVSARIMSLCHSYRIEGNKCLAIKNVYDAAYAAGVIKMIGPSRFKNIIHTICDRVRNA